VGRDWRDARDGAKIKVNKRKLHVHSFWVAALFRIMIPGSD
jgi:hypothetical protein